MNFPEVVLIQLTRGQSPAYVKLRMFGAVSGSQTNRQELSGVGQLYEARPLTWSQSGGLMRRLTRRYSAIIHRAGLFVLLLVWAATPLDAASTQVTNTSLAEVYAPFAELLNRYLIEMQTPQGGLVSAFEYDAALQQAETRHLLQRQTAKLAGFDRSTLNRRETAIAFWLNAYNYFMIAHILENPKNGEPVDSVRDYGYLLNPYRIFKREIFEVGGREFSLDEIEKEILLGKEYQQRGWKDARVHFAVNCASVGCPPLRGEPYLPGDLDERLMQNIRYALNSPRHLHLQGDTLYVSRLFAWYEADFVQAQGSVQAFIKAYGGTAVDHAVNKAKRIRYIDYNWDLNRPGTYRELDG